jgi:hypothetical protein
MSHHPSARTKPRAARSSAAKQPASAVPQSRTKEATTNESYAERYCAFVDILGFAELTNRLGTGSLSFESVRQLLRTVHAPPRGEYIRFFKGSDLKAQSISDALCLSATNSAAGLAHLIYNLEELALSLLEQGFFIRGAVVKGRVYHDGQMAFGEALVRAYRFEQEVARYPRIMITSDVAKDINDFLEKDIWEFSNYLLQADDGPYYLHVLGLVEMTLKDPAPSEQVHYVTKYNRMADQLGGCGCLNRISASISGGSAGVRPPRGKAAS